MSLKIKERIYNENICIIFKDADKSVAQFKSQLLSVIKKLNKFYKIKLPRTNIEFIYSRKEFNDKLKHKIPNWLCASTSKNNIYLLSPLIIENESNHKKSEIKKILTHELCHVFNNKINKKNLMWIDEGIALFLAKQKKDKDFTEKDLDFFMNNFFDKNINLRLFAKHKGYKISYWAIKKLAKPYKRKNLLKLLKTNRQDLKRHLTGQKKRFWKL